MSDTVQLRMTDTLRTDSALTESARERRTTTVLVRYFAGARAASGVAEEQIVLTDGDDTVASALAAVLARRGPELDRVLPSCSFLLNGTAVHDHGIFIPDGGELDILPPFAGG